MKIEQEQILNDIKGELEKFSTFRISLMNVGFVIEVIPLNATTTADLRSKITALITKN